MKNKLFYISAIILTAVLFTSCASRKYGCPNSAGMKVESKAQSINA
jgi:PBP1b-binding outer membrane lipoprotein LpoB